MPDIIMRCSYCGYEYSSIELMSNITVCPQCGIKYDGERWVITKGYIYPRPRWLWPNYEGEINLEPSVLTESEPDNEMTNKHKRTKYGSEKDNLDNTITSKADNDAPFTKDTVNRDNIEDVKGVSSAIDNNQNNAAQPQTIPHYINRGIDLPTEAIEPEEDTWNQDEESSAASTINDTDSPHGTDDTDRTTSGWSPPKPPGKGAPVISGFVITIIIGLMVVGFIYGGDDMSSTDPKVEDSPEYKRYEELQDPPSESEGADNDQVDIDDTAEQTVPGPEVYQTPSLPPFPEPTPPQTPEPTPALTSKPTIAPTPTLDPTEQTPEPTLEPTPEPTKPPLTHF